VSDQNNKVSDQNKEQGYRAKLNGKILTSVVFLPIVMWLFPSVVPFEFFEPWKSKGGFVAGIVAAWPFYAWGFSLTFIRCIMTRNDCELNRDAEGFLAGGTLFSLWAGVWEELAFRWLFFLDNIVTVKIGNFLFFGFLGFGFAEWFHLHVWGPLANLTTFGALEQYIYHPSTWAVGAAMLTTNTFFRDGHKYQGPLGWINSWFGGMFLFWIMFNYGLTASIAAHFLYNFIITAVVYVDAAVERKLGWV
jgi:hypothetical protein